MSLEMPKKGTHFVARVKVRGERVYITLPVEIEGMRPSGLNIGRGDEAFERSRRRAHTEHDNLVKDLKAGGDGKKYLEKAFHAITGMAAPKVTLAEMPQAYVDAPRRRKLTPAYLPQAIAMLKDLTGFLRKNYPQVTHMGEVQHGMALAYVTHLDEQNFSEKRYNDYLILVRGSFDKLRRQACITDNPFTGIPTKEATTINKVPYSVEELASVLKACADDDFIRPIVVTLMCTAMRRKAVCLLDWCAVDMINGFIEVDPGKGGNRTCIPIFPLLRGELERRIPRSTGYVFPDQAKMYLTNPDGITWRIQQVLCQSGFSRHGDTTTSDNDLSIPHPTGQRMVNVRGAHSFRTTWVTLAILNGVPIDIVRKVTGHRTVDVVVQNYLQPGREQIKKALADKMPLLLGPGPGPRYSEQSMVQVINSVRSQLAAMTTESWSTTRDQLLGMIETHIINRDNHAA